MIIMITTMMILIIVKKIIMLIIIIVISNMNPEIDKREENYFISSLSVFLFLPTCIRLCLGLHSFLHTCVHLNTPPFLLPHLSSLCLCVCMCVRVRVCACTPIFKHAFSQTLKRQSHQRLCQTTFYFLTTCFTRHIQDSDVISGDKLSSIKAKNCLSTEATPDKYARVIAYSGNQEGITSLPELTC